VIVPIIYKMVVDALTGGPNALLVVPVAIIIGYGIVSVAALATDEIRDVIFATVQERALRPHLGERAQSPSLIVPALSSRTQTGGLSRSIERGTDSIETLFFISFSISALFSSDRARLRRALALFQLHVAAVTFSVVIFFMHSTPPEPRNGG